MKTLIKIIAGVFGALVLVAGGAYCIFLSPPSPESVCDNVVEVTQAKLEQSGDPLNDDDLRELRTQCERDAGRAPSSGEAVWVKRLKCMRDADDYAALQSCKEIRSL